MISVNIRGTVREVIFKSENTLKMIIDNDNGAILGTITRSRMVLADKVRVGEEFEFIGNIDLHERSKSKNGYLDNIFYVIEIK